MPLERRFQGQLVTRAKRRGDRILVRVREDRSGSVRSRWLSVSLREYRSGLTTHYRHPRNRAC
jgi:hypothetical protein